MSDKGLRLSKEKFDRDGYTVISGLFSATEIDALNVQVDRYVRQIAPTLSDGASPGMGSSGTPVTAARHCRLACIRDFRDHSVWTAAAGC